METSCCTRRTPYATAPRDGSPSRRAKMWTVTSPMPEQKMDASCWTAGALFPCGCSGRGVPTPPVSGSTFGIGRTGEAGRSRRQRPEGRNDVRILQVVRLG